MARCCTQVTVWGLPGVQHCFEPAAASRMVDFCSWLLFKRASGSFTSELMSGLSCFQSGPLGQTKPIQGCTRCRHHALCDYRGFGSLTLADLCVHSLRTGVPMRHWCWLPTGCACCAELGCITQHNGLRQGSWGACIWAVASNMCTVLVQQHSLHQSKACALLHYAGTVC